MTDLETNKPAKVTKRADLFELAESRLASITALRMLTRKLGFEWLNRLQENSSVLIEEFREAWELEKLAQQELEEKRQKVLEFAQELGLKQKDLFPDSTEQRPRRGEKGEAKYRFTLPDGSEQTWTGHGRKPDRLRELLAEGHELSEFAM